MVQSFPIYGLPLQSYYSIYNLKKQHFIGTFNLIDQHYAQSRSIPILKTSQRSTQNRSEFAAHSNRN